jgi:TRAP-type C4-dicarboxylate transport system permease small subunit
VTAIRRVAQGWLNVAHALSQLSGWLLIVLSLPIAFDVIARKLGHPTAWAFDVSLYLMVTIVYIGIADGIRTGVHFRVHLLLDRLPAIRPFLDGLDLVLIFAFGAALAWAGADLAWTSYTTNLVSTTLLHVPMFIPQLVLPIGGLSLALQALALAIVRPTAPDTKRHRIPRPGPLT